MLHPVIQEAVVAYFLKTGRKHVHQVTADELCVIKGNAPFWGTSAEPPGRKSNGILCDGKDPAVGNSDLMCVTAKILDGITETVKGFLYVRTPVFFIKTVFPFFPAIRITKLIAGGRKNKGTALV